MHTAHTYFPKLLKSSVRVNGWARNGQEEAGPEVHRSGVVVDHHGQHRLNARFDRTAHIVRQRRRFFDLQETEIKKENASERKKSINKIV